MLVPGAGQKYSQHSLFALLYTLTVICGKGVTRRKLFENLMTLQEILKIVNFICGSFRYLQQRNIEPQVYLAPMCIIKACFTLSNDIVFW